ncbi:MAG: RNA polymerase factor sigma-54 [Pseudohongiellaceae bacterium]
MKLSLQLKLGQQLTMTPQLQQAIRLLQLSTLDLQQEIHEALETNPMLEMDESDDGYSTDAGNTDHNGPGSDEETAVRQQNETEQSRTASADTDSTDAPSRDDQDDSSKWEESIPEDLSVDTSWDDIYQSSYSTGLPAGGDADGDYGDFESRNSAGETLQDHLHWQLNLTPMSDTDHAVAMSIIDGIDANGMLTVSVESLHESLADELDIEEDEVLAVLHRIQQFDPVGVGYRDLSECLLIQLAQLSGDEATDSVRHARILARDHLSLLGSRDYSQIMRKMRIREPALRDAITVIEGLNPRPGADISPPQTDYVVPDVFVRKDPESGRWRVELNAETAPRLRINPDYAALVKRADNSRDNGYLKDNLQEARWFLKSLQSRNETLLKVATRIVEHQQDFLEHGEEAMKPLVLHDIAETVEMHESTISRVTTQKYMHTPRGVFELKYFFSSHVSTDSGGEASSTAIRALIRKLVSGENTRKPLSDSKIANLLKDQGINVARRTIAKYRESMNIPPSNERKKLG